MGYFYPYRPYYGGYPGWGGYGGWGCYDGCGYGNYYNLLSTSVPAKTSVDKPIDKPQVAIVLKAVHGATIPSVFTQAQIDELSSYINNYRAAHQAPPLSWDTTIATFSQRWANYLLKNNLFQHSGSAVYGENLAYLQGYGNDLVTLVKLAIDLWYNEVKLYDFTKPGFSEETGHFTALVWKSSVTFGLGFAINPVTDVVDITMNISAPGNVIGAFDVNVLPSVAPIVVSPILPVPTVVPSVPYNIPIVPMDVPVKPQPQPHSQCDNSSVSSIKLTMIQALFNIINEIKANKPSDMILTDLNKAIMDIVSI